MLKRTICTQSFCQTCKDIFTTDQILPEHKFICEREYKKGVLKLPSRLAIDFFSHCEASFQKNREMFFVPQKQKNVDKLAEKLHGSLKEYNEFKDLPQCHMLLMINRFFKFRMCFWSDYMNTQVVEKRKAKIKKDAAIKRSSKSMTGFHL